MTHPTVLVNFRIPRPLKQEFEASCRRLHMPMTAQVNLLMREFIHDQKQQQAHGDDTLEPLSFYNDGGDPL